MLFGIIVLVGISILVEHELREESKIYLIDDPSSDAPSIDDPLRFDRTFLEAMTPYQKDIFLNELTPKQQEALFEIWEKQNSSASSSMQI